MNKNEVILLYKNGNAERKNESSISLEDLRQSKYIMVDTSIMKNEPSRNFVLIDSSNYLYFTKAIIDYQLYGRGWDPGNNDESIETLKPVHVETSSISDLINLINCINRIQCLNDMILEEETCGEGIRVHVQYFQIVLYRAEKKIYDKFYSYDENHKKKNSRYITRIFYNLYATPTLMMFKNEEYLILTNKNTWKIGTSGKYSMLGVPLKESDTITLCRQDELYRLSEYTDLNCTFSVHDESSYTREQLNKNIKKGRYDEVENLGVNLDYFMCCYTAYKIENQFKFILLEIISCMRFFVCLTNLIYNEIYDGMKGEYVNDIFDSVLSLNLYKKHDINPRTIYINEESILTINDFLAII